MSKTIVEADSKIYMEIQMARIIKVITLKKNKLWFTLLGVQYGINRSAEYNK